MPELNPRYDLLEQLGEGGAGSVHKAWDKRLQRYVAIKRLHPPEDRLTGGGDNLAKEASALSALQHPNIVSVYDLDEWDGEPCVIMEFLNGESLEATLNRGALAVDDFCSVVSQTMEGLVAAHRLGVQHRDLKPGNIMVNWLPNGDFILKMLDFGLADFSGRAHQQITDDENVVYGSIHFMAPEQFARRPVDARTDLYSLGCVLYFAASGRYPFTGASAQTVIDAHLAGDVVSLDQVRPDLPIAKCNWIHWLMRRDPNQRPQTAEAALRVWKGLQDGTLREIPQPGLKTQPVKTASEPSKSRSGLPPSQTVGGDADTKRGIPRYAGWMAGGGLVLVGLVLMLFHQPANDTPETAATSSSEQISPTAVPAADPIETVPPVQETEPEPAPQEVMATSSDQEIKSAAKTYVMKWLKVGGSILPEKAPKVANIAFTISCTIETEQQDAIILAHGGIGSGYALHLRGGRLVFTVRHGPDNEFDEVVSPTVISGRTQLIAKLTANKSLLLSVDGKEVASVTARSLIPRNTTENFCLGHDNRGQVIDYHGSAPFSGKIAQLIITTE